MDDIAYVKEYRSWDGRLLMQIGYDIDWSPLILEDLEAGIVIDWSE